MSEGYLPGVAVFIKSRKISKKLITTLSGLICDEFNAIHHYLMHSAVCKGWGYTALSEKFKEESLEEQDHASWLMDRLTVFNKVPVLDGFPKVDTVTGVRDILEVQVRLEEQAIKSYQDAVKVANSDEDYDTELLLKKILSDEEVHYDWLKAQLDQIDQMGLAMYLSSKNRKHYKSRKE